MKDTLATNGALDHARQSQGQSQSPTTPRAAGRAGKAAQKQLDVQTLLQAYRSGADDPLPTDLPVNVATDFLRTVTNPQAPFPPASSLDAVAFLHDLLERRNCRLLS